MNEETETLALKGHNVGGVAVERLRSLVDRIERLTEEKKAITNDIADIYKESKSAGFDVKALRKLIKDRAQDPAALQEIEDLLDIYKRALGC